MTRPLTPDVLRKVCPPESLPFGGTDELKPLEEVVAQDRAVEAITFGIGIRCEGFNLFVLGPAGAGKTTAIKRFLASEAAKLPTPPDWCYVNNFADPQRPRALCLPPGRAHVLQSDCERLLEELKTGVPRAFESEAYEQNRQTILEELQKQTSDRWRRGRPRWGANIASNAAAADRVGTLSRTPRRAQALPIGRAVRSQPIRAAAARLPLQQPAFDRADRGVEREREHRQHDDPGHHGVDVEHALGLMDQVAHAAGRSQVLAHHRADEGQPHAGVQRAEDPARRARQVDVAQQLARSGAEHPDRKSVV